MRLPPQLDQVLAFAEAEDNIRAVVVTGSTARGATHALSDLDVELYVTIPEKLLDDDSWHARFGHVVAVEALPNPGWHPTRLLYLRGAKKIDFMIAPVSALAGARYDRPFVVAIDKDDLAARLAPPLREEGRPPTHGEFLECLNWFAAAAIMCAKCVVREDLWMAKVRDWDLKQQLLRMIEWDHRSRYGWDYDTWSLGKNMAHWMDSDIRSELLECWGRFDPEDARRALSHSLTLFRRLAERVGPLLSAPHFDHDVIALEVEEILNRRYG